MTIELSDCMQVDCGDACCGVGVDVWPTERALLLDRGLAGAADFTGPTIDEAGDTLYRTAIGLRGCVFLHPDRRGCRLHHLGVKPSTCTTFPADEDDVITMQEAGLLPCLPPLIPVTRLRRSDG